jgi:hypothetical protein
LFDVNIERITVKYEAERIPFRIKNRILLYSIAKAGAVLFAMRFSLVYKYKKGGSSPP